MDKHMEKMMKMMDKDFTISQRILEINLNHPLIINLNKLFKDGKTEKLNQLINHIYDTCLLNDGILNNVNDYSERLLNIMIEASN